ncbi:LysR family transcriptional regulator [Roseobacter cerasinus]|uniref:LysR family transcriptional regulator n=1 Tax=Roseobacter cerasinus TaxID=2602289 RepID=A0A640VVL0_9RHOB|nr:LysR family transcriptional regulator [Roseobacter cerasinus]GFE52448.1 LysR family transcriptional regulator [Roseobacter cerasinus]
MNNRKNGLEWDDLRFFLALSRAGSLMGAARMLGVEHSTVARRITGLEEALGLRLFDRLPRGWRPTTEGQHLIARAEAVENEVVALTRAASGIDSLSGEVRVSAPPLLLAHLIASAVVPLMTSHPGITPLLVGTTERSDLNKAEADIALRLGAIADPDLVIRSVGSVGYGLYARADQANRPPRERVYLSFEEPGIKRPQSQWLREKVSLEGARIGLRSNDMTTLINASRAGLGIAMLPRFFAAKFPELLEVPDAASFPAQPLHLVMHADIRLAPRVRLVADHLYDEVRRSLTCIT